MKSKSFFGFWVAGALTMAGGSAALATEAPPSAQGARPAMMRYQDARDGLVYRVKVRPGVATPGETVTVTLELARSLGTPDPIYGRHAPLREASVYAVFTGPEGGRAQNLDSRHGLKMRDTATWGFTFTAAAEGVYGLHFRGETVGAGSVDYAVPITYGVWPMPPDQKVPPLPSKIPVPNQGNSTRGRQLCESLCKTDAPGALPAGAAPTYLSSYIAESYTDAKLLATMLGAKAKRLTQLQRNDVVYYLRGLHRRVQHYFPEAGRVVPNRFTINENGLLRLEDATHADVSDDEASAMVFTVYRAERSDGGHRRGAPELIPYQDRVRRDQINSEDKLGYLIFFDVDSRELAMALGREPTYPIIKIDARSKTGESVSRFNRDLASFQGRGRFNDPRSLSGGARALTKKLVPIYLRAAELATMYYGEEREFTAFDREFD